MGSWFVVQKYYVSGNVKANILTEKRARKKGYYDGYRKKTKAYDLYVDELPTREWAKEERNEALDVRAKRFKIWKNLWAAVRKIKIWRQA